MSIEWELPNLGEGVTEADIADILVSEGDQIEADQVVMELETEKAVLELPCPHAGKIEKLLVSTGQTIQVGQKILVLSGNGASASGPETAAKPASASPSTPAPAASSPVPAEAPIPSSVIVTTMTQTAPGRVVEFKLPALGEGVKSADVAAVRVAVGETISADAVVMELETEKAVMELPCPYGGKITGIHVKPGDTITVGQPVLTIESTAGAARSPAPVANLSPPAAALNPAAPQKPAGVAPPKSERPVLTGSPQASVPGSAGQELPVPASPSTRRLARQLGVDLRQVPGTERGGRITAEDVQAYVRQRMTSATPARIPAGPISPAPGGMLAPPPLPDFTRFGEITRERMNKLGRTAAENLTLSWNVIPHVTQHDRVDITDLESARKKFAEGIGKNGPKITQTAIVIKALVKCLQAFPKFNGSLDPETFEIVFKHYYHIGCAVDTPNGLVVPVVKDCDKKSILQIAAEISELAAKARDRKLTPEEMQGGTCTITNLGGIGGVAFTPIVNYPEVCILGLSRGQSELKLINGQVVERLMLPVSLSYDHRVINGADAARFVVMLGNLLGDPFQLMTSV